jgi:CRISPR-associated endonuclease Cas1
MAAHQNVSEVPLGSKSLVHIVPQQGVLTVFGYGIRIRIERGHLTIEDGIAGDRRKARLARVGHGLRRLVLIGSDGFISLSALRWLADQDAAFVMLERDGSVLTTTGPVYPSDARLRRAQSMAFHSGLALTIARELIHRKLVGQEIVARTKLCNESAAEVISQMIAALSRGTTIETVCEVEARAANAYWLAWRELPIQFPSRELSRVPNHWRRFGTRRSPLTGSPRLAVNPPNAMLNYLYAMLESESRLALAALGLDPGIGVLHFDSRSRDSFACDLMEAARPDVDAYVLDWLTKRPLSRSWFFEQCDGNCRLMSGFAAQLSVTANMLKAAISPVAEWISRALWSTLPKPSRTLSPATRLTQSYRRISKGGDGFGPEPSVVRLTRVCHVCGNTLKRSMSQTCRTCAVAVNRTNMIEAAKLGRIATHSASAEARRGETQAKQRRALCNWNPDSKPEWLSEAVFRSRIQPLLSRIEVPRIAKSIDVSHPYATSIRRGDRLPHPRHWQNLANLTGVNRPRGVSLCDKRDLPGLRAST